MKIHNSPWGAVQQQEDCEWALVALAYPQYFDGRSMFYAVKTVQVLAAVHSVEPVEVAL